MAERDPQAVCAALCAALPSPMFLSFSRFLLTVVHNIVLNPKRMMYRKMTTTNKNVTLGFESESAKPLIQRLGIVKKGDFYCIPGEVNVDDLRAWEAALIAARKSLGVLEGWELFTQDIVQGERIGAGTFGDVFAGTWNGQAVAIKTLKPDATQQSRKDFFAEADIMKNLVHEHVPGLVGVVVSKQPEMIVMELLRGNLQDTLRATEFTLEQQLSTATQLAAGMVYIHGRGVLHCDLAVRNVLCGVDGVVKIADFGLARRADSSQCDVSARVFPIPVRWSAPEVWKKRYLTYATDMWSFAVLLYEVFTRGAIPYVTIPTNAAVQAKVEDGLRLTCPPTCPETLFALLPPCWDTDPTARPSAASLASGLASVTAQLHAAPAGNLNTASDFRLSRRLGTRARKSRVSIDTDRGYMAVGGDEDSGPDDSSQSTASFSSSGLISPTAAMQLSPSAAPATLGVSLSSPPAVRAALIPAARRSVIAHRVASKRVREQSEPWLRRAGQFMVHPTLVPGEYVISVRGKANQQLSLLPDKQGMYTLANKKFASIEALVEHFMGSGEALDIDGRKYTLDQPVLPEESSTDPPPPLTPAADDTHYDIFICYQPETEGALARSLYDALGRLQDPPLTCFLDQYDLDAKLLSGGPQSWLTGIERAVARSSLFVALVSEKAFSIARTHSSFDTVMSQYEIALTRGGPRLRIVPIFVGQYHTVTLPHKPGKQVQAYEPFDDATPDVFPDAGSDTNPQLTMRDTVSRILTAYSGLPLHARPDDEQLEGLAAQVALCLECLGDLPDMSATARHQSTARRPTMAAPGAARALSPRPSPPVARRSPVPPASSSRSATPVASLTPTPGRALPAAAVVVPVAAKGAMPSRMLSAPPTQTIQPVPVQAVPSRSSSTSVDELRF
eukprot:m.171404 g.171404  ORF g.171404 m.171404 type:complete len:901 (-) comp15285_c2_seq17:199-2901(-)